MLRYRLLLGPLLVLILTAMVWADARIEAVWGYSGALLIPLTVIIAIIAARELTKIFRALRITTSVRLNAIAAVLGLLVAGLDTRALLPVSPVAVICTAGGLIYAAALVHYSRRHSAEGVVAASGATLLVFTYIGLLGAFILLLRREHSPWLLLAIVLIVKSYDIGAYTFGRIFGRRKLIPWLSPGKTWEGLFGGLAVAALVGGLATVILNRLEIEPELAFWQGLIVGFVLGAVGQAGDLVASMLKRDAGIKDYSRALPGFGGILDVIDSPLFAVPVAYWALAIFVASASP